LSNIDAKLYAGSIRDPDRIEAEGWQAMSAAAFRQADRSVFNSGSLRFLLRR
jgi:hypothetical protein